MDREFWISRWTENRIGFHRAGVHPLLKRYWADVAQSPAGRTLVPLCGKSEDLRWLAERGHDVAGVDLSEVAAESFASEQGVAFTRTNEPPFLVFRGTKVTFYVGDFFNFTSAVGGRFDLFYDRAALIALPSEMRPAYARQLQSLMAEGSRGLLITLEYDIALMEGPPFSVSQAEVQALFDEFHCERLLEEDCLEKEPRFKQRGLSWLKEVVYRLVRRQ